MSPAGYVNISAEIFGGLLSLVFIVHLSTKEYNKDKLNRLFVRTLVCNAVILFSDAIAWIAKGNMDTLNYVLVRLSNFTVFCASCLLVGLFTDYLVAYIESKTAVPRSIRRVVWGLCILGMLTTIISQFTHIYYYFDENNMYVRGDWFFVSQIWGVACMAIDAFVVIKYRRYLSRREFLLLLSYELVPALALVVQIMVYGLAVLHIVLTLVILAIYVGIQSDQARLLKERELELAEGRIAIMLSQIQPHFLYNSLAAIGQLCVQDPKQANEAVMDFSDYLRGNLDSLTKKEPIPFEEELTHTKAYLALESRRFEERLHTILDIEAADFYLPALCLQPIVENAVRYGIANKRGGGTLTIRTREEKERFLITVEDNGTGFEPGQKADGGRSHIGLENVANRLKMVCDGELTIASEPGKGTIARISIPKGGYRR
ncbi:histidine kinase [Christensenellaceae bacterium OttesenSCG-928-M15]|nr:histidine kinase [Christensenellaceae bacterium OttesenSCG-928-M15]